MNNCIVCSRFLAPVTPRVTYLDRGGEPLDYCVGCYLSDQGQTGTEATAISQYIRTSVAAALDSYLP